MSFDSEIHDVLKSGGEEPTEELMRYTFELPGQKGVPQQDIYDMIQEIRETEQFVLSQGRDMFCTAPAARSEVASINRSLPAAIARMQCVSAPASSHEDDVAVATEYREEKPKQRSILPPMLPTTRRTLRKNSFSESALAALSASAASATAPALPVASAEEAAAADEESGRETWASPRPFGSLPSVASQSSSEAPLQTSHRASRVSSGDALRWIKRNLPTGGASSSVRPSRQATPRAVQTADLDAAVPAAAAVLPSFGKEAAAVSGLMSPVMSSNSTALNSSQGAFLSGGSAASESTLEGAGEFVRSRPARRSLVERILGNGGNGSASSADGSASSVLRVFGSSSSRSSSNGAQAAAGSRSRSRNASASAGESRLRSVLPTTTASSAGSGSPRRELP